METKFIKFIFDLYLEDFSTFFSKELDLESDIIKDCFLKWQKLKSKPIKKSEPISKTKDKQGICQFKLPDSNICGAKIRNGIGSLCSKHKIKKNIEPDAGIIIQRDIKTKSWNILGTNLVVDGPENRIVIGSISSGKIGKLNDDDIEKAKELKLKIKN